uniref:Uncharacterized protein n=1 Tax=Arundo donax TaxID=35708 RepID=A0A0A9G7S3_ARUDO
MAMAGISPQIRILLFSREAFIGSTEGFVFCCFC